MSGESIAAVRGAIQVAENRAELVQAATARLLTELLARNGIEPDRIVSAIFTATPDLNADFPAHAARRLGWTDVPLLGAMEMAVPGALPRIVRVLLTVAGVPAGRKLVPVYLEGAAALRPDLAPPPSPRGDARRIAIVGLGQIGGSIGLALGAGGAWRRIGWDTDRGALARARDGRALDETAPSLAAACGGADVVVVATPVDAIPACIAEAAAAMRPGAALLDTGSTRAGITPALREAAKRGVRAVGGHPLAGNEGHGIDSARADLLRGAGFVLCEIEETGPLPPVVLDLVEALGAKAILTSPEDHDVALARTSHLPYLLARALRRCGEGDAARGLSGPTFRDMTRVARSDPRVAEAYCRANLAAVREAWERVRTELDRQIAALAAPARGA